MTFYSPSILSADFADLKSELNKVKKAKYLHLDVMDGNFVPNISFGPAIISSLRPLSNLMFDTHLMIERPERYIKEFVDAGSNIITIHVEATKHLHRTIYEIKNRGCQAGVALNPTTPLNVLDYILDELDLVLIMSVNPGFAGQNFINSTLNKIENLHDIIDKKSLSTKIEVDGGINLNNVSKVIDAGADIIVVGSAIYGQADPELALKDFMRNR
jgi:ribulose-phosphate 3-epimerase